MRGRTKRVARRLWAGGAFFALTLGLWGCGGGLGGGVGGPGRPGELPPSVQGSVGRPATADGEVTGRITAASGSTRESVVVELLERTGRVVARTRAGVGEDYSLAYSSTLVNCWELAVRFVAATMTHPSVRYLGRCGSHRVDYEVPAGE